MRLFRVTLRVENGMSDTESVSYVDIHPSSGKIQDVRFVDDENIMLAVVRECKYLRVYTTESAGLTRYM